MRRAALLLAIVPVLVATFASGALASERQRPGWHVHPLVRTWIVDVNTDDTRDPPALVSIAGDGTLRLTDCCNAPAAGVWAPGSIRTADATLLLPWNDEDGFVGFNTVRADVVVSADGGSLTATYTMDIPDREGGTTGQLGPASATGVRVLVEAMGAPVGPLPIPAPEEELAPEEVPSASPEASPAS
jgi:hypothetical protein